jgi:hypothetical protein
MATTAARGAHAQRRKRISSETSWYIGRIALAQPQYEFPTEDYCARAEARPAGAPKQGIGLTETPR